MKKILLILIAMIISLANIDFKLVDRSSLINSTIKVEIVNEDKREVINLRYGDTIDDLLKIKDIDVDYNFYPLNYVLSDNEIINTSKYSINNVSVEKLSEIPYISSELAKAIVLTREKLGKFKSIDDLRKVKGLGEVKLKILLKFIEI